MSAPLLEVRGLRTWLDTEEGTLRAVDGVDLDLRRGETFALLGESGCGKSMVALSIMRLLPESAQVVGGEVRLEGEDLLRLPEAAMRDVRGGRIAMIFQEPQTALNPVLTVSRQIGECLERHRGLTGRARDEAAAALLDDVGIPDVARRLGEYPHQLSGGMKQRVMIAMALAGEPDLLIADEPTTALDVTIQAQVLELLGELQARRNMSLLLITHDLAVVAGRADRIGIMYAGHLIEVSAARSFFREPLHPYSAKLFTSLPSAARRGARLEVIDGVVPRLTAAMPGCRFADRCPKAWERCRSQAPSWWEPVQDRLVRCHLHDASDAARGARGPGAAEPAARVPDETEGPAAPAIEGSGGEPLLQVRDLAVHFPIRSGVLKRVLGHVRAVDGVSLSIRAGRTLALVGESGCGKTTAGKGILQLVKPTAGSVRLTGDDLTTMDGERLRRRRRDIQIIFQDPYASMNPRMMVGDIIEEGMIALGIGGDAGSRLERVARLLDQVGLDAGAQRRYPHEFSGGQRQRICIARALAVEPRLIVCDEPTSALDVSVQAQILNLLRDLQVRLGIGYLFITHDISVVEYMAHEVAVMYLGCIVEHGPTEQVLGRPLHPYTEALLSAVPVPDPEAGRRIIRLAGELPSAADPPSGCHFHPRCPRAMEQCAVRYPGPRASGGEDRTVHCHLY